MKIYYDKPKGHRIKKGTYKSNGRRVPMFFALTPLNIDNSWWCDDLNKWCTVEETKGLSCGTHNSNIRNLKQAIRHIKKHKELAKGTKLRLCSNFVGYGITIIV